MRVELPSGAPVPRIAVVTPTRNRLALLRETMASVAAQTCTDWEHIVVDDGSDDGTPEFAEGCAAGDPRVRYFKRTGEPGGANVCRNLGLRESRADLIVFLDSDDLLEPEALARRVELMDRNRDLDFAVTSTGVFMVRPGDLDWPAALPNPGDDLLRFLSFDPPWQTTAPTWRRGALQRLGGFDEALPSWQDIDLHVRAIAGGLRYLRSTDVDHHMRWQLEAGKISIDQRRSPKHLEAAQHLFAKFHRAVSEGPGLTWTRQRAIAGLYFMTAERWVEIGRLADGLACWRLPRAQRQIPRSIHLSGAILLMLAFPARLRQALTARLIHKWKGWARFRIDPELVDPAQGKGEVVTP